MNRRQMVVLWIIVLMLSAVAAVEGASASDGFIGFGIPTLLIGGTLIYQFRDKQLSKAQAPTNKILIAVLAMMVLQTLLLGAGVRELKHSNSKLDDAASTLDDINSNVTEMQSDVSTIQSDVGSR